MELIYTITFFSILLLFFLLRNPLFRPRNRKKLPPGPNGVPILGSLLQLGARPHESLLHMAQRHGPLITLQLGFVTTVVASTAEAAREILGKHDQTFSDRTVPDVITAQPNPEATLAWVPGDSAWRNRRRTCTTQLLTAARLDALQNQRHEKVRQLLRHIEIKHCVNSSPVDIGQVAFATTLNLMSSTMFSFDIVDPEFETAQEFKEVVWRIMEDAGKINFSDYFPVLRWFDLQGIKRHIKVSYLRLHEIFDDIIEKRLEQRKVVSGGGDSKKGDFLDMLLDLCQEEGSGFNRQTIKPLFLDLFIAGSDTSAITTEWAMAELIKNPEILHKARQEVDQVIGPDRPVRESDIDNLPYLQAIVKETMRLHPAVPLLLPYKSNAEVEISGGYTIPKGIQVLVNAWAISRDPTHWPDPTSFRPERFVGSGVDYKGRDFEYIPFGAGRRLCPGWPLGVRMVHLMVASLVKTFRWRVADGEEELDMEEQYGVSLRKKVPLRLVPSLA